MRHGDIQLQVYHDIKAAIKGKDIICTDSLPAKGSNGFISIGNLKLLHGWGNRIYRINR